MIRLTLLAVVVRLGLTLWWLSRQRADLEALAASDPLTGLGNYRAFQEHLQRAVAAEETVSLIVLDLDHFKMLNDTFGHAEGDRVLQATATTLSRTVGEAGFVARVGGEEFAIALLSPEVKRALPFDLDGIVIELTEHEAFDEDGALELGLAAALRERGARIALDDAGAGYAGLQQLIRLRPEIVKVDRSLIAGIHEDASKLALLQALAGFAGTDRRRGVRGGRRGARRAARAGGLRRDLRAGLRARAPGARLAGDPGRGRPRRPPRPTTTACAWRARRTPARRPRSATWPTCSRGRRRSGSSTSRSTA